jgi:hypothetical protein
MKISFEYESLAIILNVPVCVASGPLFLLCCVEGSAKASVIVACLLETNIHF